LIMNAHVLFDEHTAQQPYSPPLPPTPAGEVALEVSYGSKTTKIASMPAKSLSPPPASPPQDFTPKLPPRPATSIHPSSRGLPTSPVRLRSELSSPTLVTQSSTSNPPSPSHASTISDTDDSLSYHDPGPSGDRGSVREPSTSTVPDPWPTSSHRKTELPPTPKETPAASPLEPDMNNDK